MSSSSWNLALGGVQDRPRCLSIEKAIEVPVLHTDKIYDAVGIIIRVTDLEGKCLPNELTRTTQVSNLNVELDLEGRTRLREQPSPANKRPQTSPGDISSFTNKVGDVRPRTASASEQTQTLIRVLKRNFSTMIHAFALFDADNGNEVGLMEVRSAVRWLLKHEKGKGLGDEEALANFDAKAFIQELSSSQLAGRGATLNLNDFVRKIIFGDTLENWKVKLEEARKWRDSLLAQELFNENKFVSEMAAGFLDELKAALKEKFENAAEAFVFFDRTCTGVLTEAHWHIGLKRIGVTLNVKHLMMVIDDNCADGRVDEAEFKVIFSWHPPEKWDALMFEAKTNRRAIANRITMASFKENKKKLPPLVTSTDTSCRSKDLDFSLINSSLTVGNNTFIGSAKRGAVQWQMQFITRLAAVVNPPANPDRFVFVGFQEGDIVLAILPDLSDRKRTPDILAKAVHDALEKPDNVLRAWDPSVQGASKTSLIKTRKWDFLTNKIGVKSSGLLDPKMTSNLLREPLVVRREHVRFPRSDVGFKKLGALDHWSVIDGIGKVGFVKDSFPLSLFYHKDLGIMFELLHCSPGFFCFQAVPGGPVLCCTEEGRVSQRSDLVHKGDQKGPAWKFHSSDTVKKFLEPRDTVLEAPASLQRDPVSRPETAPGSRTGTSPDNVGMTMSRERSSSTVSADGAYTAREEVEKEHGVEDMALMDVKQALRARSLKYSGPDKVLRERLVQAFIDEKGLDLKARFSKLTSSVPGRWIVGISVPHVIIENNSDNLLQLVLTQHGFVVLGGGSNPVGLIVERGEIRSISVEDAIDYVRHQPSKDNDLTELDHLAKSQQEKRKTSLYDLQVRRSVFPMADSEDSSKHESEISSGSRETSQLEIDVDSHIDRQSDSNVVGKEDLAAVLKEERRTLKLDLDSFFNQETEIQSSYQRMLISQGFRECCSLLKRLQEPLSIGSILDASDRINRRAQLVRLCGDYGKEWAPGTGTTTHLAFLVDEISSKISEKNLKISFVRFFRMEYHEAHQVIAHLARQLMANIPEGENSFSGKMIHAISSYSHEKMARLLHDLCMIFVLKDTPVIIVVDNLHLAEQRVLQIMVDLLRKSLQPWFYHLKRLGYVRVVFSGRDGYRKTLTPENIFSVPAGGPITTMQLDRLSETMAKQVLTKMLRVRNKHISPDHVETLLKKKDACRMQYLRVAASVIERYWVFEQNNGYFEALPEELSGLYAHNIRILEEDFGAELVEEILVMLAERETQGSLSFLETKNKFSSDAAALQRIPALFDALRELLRIAPAATQCLIADDELRAAIRQRYNGGQQKMRAEEAVQKERASELRKLQLEKCLASVLERHNNCETGCVSLHQAVDAAAAGDEVIIQKKNVHLKSGLVIDRKLTISCSKPDTVVHIGYGQAILQIGDDELQRLEPQQKFVVTVNGVKFKQTGFEAVGKPYCCRVSANAELCLNRCHITSDRGVGIIVADGTLVMEDSLTVLCGSQGIVVQQGGRATLEKCQLVANWLPELSPAEKEMHEMFIAFCKGEKANCYERRVEVESHTEKQIIKLSALGKRATTLDFFEFLEILKFLKIYPALITKTEASNIFKEVNQTQDADEDSTEMDWIEFKGLMHVLCKRLNKDGFMGVSKEELAPKDGDREEAWKSANGIVIRGSSSHVQVKNSLFLNCIQGCIVKNGASAEIHNSKFHHCGKDRADSAALNVIGKGSLATCYGCEVSDSDHHGVKAEAQGQIRLNGTKIFKVKHQGVLSVGRESKVTLDGCELMNIGLCGLRANQNGNIQVVNTLITRCYDTGILASFLGTYIDVQGGVKLEGNGAAHSTSRGIIAENEGTVYVSGQNDFRDALIAQRLGRIEDNQRKFHSQHTTTAKAKDESIVDSESSKATIEELSMIAAEQTINQNDTQISDVLPHTEGHAPSTVTRKLNKKFMKTQPQTYRVMSELSKLFHNVAEAFVMLDMNTSGGVSIEELGRGLKYLQIDGVDMPALGEELKLGSGVEMDADAFIQSFMWHGKEIFPEGSWQNAYVDASRQRKRIMARFYERSGIAHEDNNVLGSNWKAKFVTDEMDKRLRLQRNFQQNLIKNLQKRDHRAERKKGMQYIKAGNIYRTMEKCKQGQPVCKFQSKYGLPGTPSLFNTNAGVPLIDARVDCGQLSLVRKSRNSLPFLADLSISDTRMSSPGDTKAREGEEAPSVHEMRAEGTARPLRPSSRQRQTRTFNPLFAD